MSTKWDENFDVVMIGSGIAGVATALAAREFGLHPVELENSDKLGGGTSFSMGGIWIGNNHLTRNAGYKDSGDDVLAYMRFVGAEETDDSRLLAYVDRGPEALKFYEDLGVRFRISIGLTDHYFGVAPGSVAEGRCLNTDFIAATDVSEWQDSILAPRDTPIEVNSTELFEWGIVTDKGRIAATRGVMLACGAYESNPAMAQVFEGLPGWLSMFSPTIDGDGIMMGAEIV